MNSRRRIHESGSIVWETDVASIFSDNGNVNVNSSNAYFPNVGGNYNEGGNVGLFYCNVNYNSTNTNSNVGSRLSSSIKKIIISGTLHLY